MTSQHSLFSPVELSTPIIHLILYILFFFSGCSALIYQVMWQRMLFTVFGVDLQSITIIVSAFMFGLGVGGIIGGRLADYMTERLLTIYVVIELGIALFGFFSPWLIEQLGSDFFSASEMTTVIASFLIHSIPTVLMGATFPILVTHVHRYTQNIGESVGALYFANTMGGALGAYLSGFVLLFSMDTAGAIAHAAILNLLIALVAVLMFRGN